MRKGYLAFATALAATLSGLLGCNDSPTVFINDPEYQKISSLPDDTTKLRLLGEYIAMFIRDPTCTGGGDCRVMAIGVNPCGGPTGYLIYSVAATDSLVLRFLVDEYDALNDYVNQKYQLDGPCYVPFPPTVDCVDGTCAQVVPRDPRDLTDDQLSGEMASVRQQIVAAIGDPVCTGPDQCRTLPMGAKPCGGPYYYLVYSVAVTDSTTVRALAARYHELDEEMNRRFNRISDCMIVLPPPVGCVDGRCDRLN